MFLLPVGIRDFQLFPRWSVDWGYVNTRHTRRGLCLGWSVCGFQGKAKSFWDWPGNVACDQFSSQSPPFFTWLTEEFLQKYIELAAALEGLSLDVPLYKITEGNEPSFFTTYFLSWDATKATVCALVFYLLLCFTSESLHIKLSNQRRADLFWQIYIKNI